MDEQSRLKEVAKLFLKLGIIGFGGPAVHIAMMEEEVVRKRKWINHQHFLDLIGATNLIPGPNSTEMTMHIGHEQAGWKGLVVAGCCFIFPAVIISGFFGWAYRQYGALPQVQQFIYGIKPAIIAVVVSLMIALGKKALKTTELWIIGVVCLVLALAGVNQIVILFGAGLAGVLLQLLKQKSTFSIIFPFNLLQMEAFSFNPFNWKLFWIFLKIGSILYGSGYVLFAFLDTELVKTGMLTNKQLVDAIAVGQFTPGPVFSSATFIGWQIGGVAGAIAATLGIFLPSFLFVGFLNPLIPKLRYSKIMSAFLDAVNVASVALIVGICTQIGRESITDWRTILIAALSFFISIIYKKLNSAFVVIGGAVLGYFLSFI